MTLITIIFAIVVFGILIAFPLVKRGHGKVPFSPRTAAKQPREEVNLPPANAPESDRNEDKKKGYFFEQFVVSKFSEQYFTLMHWRSDKFFNGIYAQSNKQHELEYEFKLHGQITRFAVECKWRNSLNASGYIDLCKQYQLDNYCTYKKEKGIPVFVVVGIGGIPDNPEELFIIPLQEVETINPHFDFMKHYQRHEVNKMFFFD